MRVLCIDGKPRPKEWPGFVQLEEGKEYNVVCERTGFYTDFSVARCYQIEGIDIWWYEIDRFIPLSEIDELELAKERQEQLV